MCVCVCVCVCELHCMCGCVAASRSHSGVGVIVENVVFLFNVHFLEPALLNREQTQLLFLS